jgi:hypothetical protein
MSSLQKQGPITTGLRRYLRWGFSGIVGWAKAQLRVPTIPHHAAKWWARCALPTLRTQYDPPAFMGPRVRGDDKKLKPLSTSQTAA